MISVAPEPIHELPQPPFAPIEKIDIAICTWNRAELLEKTLGSIKRLIVPYQVQLRVIVVDNGSTDDTQNVLRAFANDHAFTKRHRVLLLTEDQQGHTYARNRAVEHIDSDLLIWTDDDVLLDASMVQGYVEFADANLDIAFFGGKIEPDFEITPEPWITENWDKLKGCFAARDLGDEPLPLTKDRLPYGANFAIRTEVQKCFPFDATLGRRGQQVNGEDELEMMRRVIVAGYDGSWVPAATVRHFIDRSRTTELYVREYFVGQGRALAAKGEAWSDSVGGLKWRSFRKFAAYRFKRQFAPSEQWVSLMLESSLAAGQAIELGK
ncbi:glycosyltransferase [Mariniblastus fucicola]|uniref:N-glycosyltransferase n=1 Tax=Mariniblastus fucicola TaxID=980251 RepID=A0A5B9P3I9_9BACT|nr:glycosyltransferase [Mariniblastus fucicola]QEG20754.1 N-glycosyltransferase [Mariniblastus fucicola]